MVTALFFLEMYCCRLQTSLATDKYWMWTADWLHMYTVCPLKTGKFVSKLCDNAGSWATYGTVWYSIYRLCTCTQGAIIHNYQPFLECTKILFFHTLLLLLKLCSMQEKMLIFSWHNTYTGKWPDLSIWGDRSIALADRSPKGVRRDRFIDRLTISMRSNFQFHVISRIDIGLFC